MKSVLAFVLVAVVAAATAVGSLAQGSKDAKSGGVFRLGTSSTIDSLNPFVAFSQEAYNTFTYIYPALVLYDRSNRDFVPDLATSWKVSNGGKTWTFRTQPDAKWSDGQPLTAADAAWMINTSIKYQATGAANMAGLIAHITSASAPNPTTLVVQYKQPVGNVLAQLEQLPILPQHVWSKYTGHKGADLKTFKNNAPVVSGGAFVLAKYTPKEIALYQRNDTFYGPKPKVDGFGLQMFANDDALVTALKNHEIDAVEAVPTTAVKTLKSAGFKINVLPGGQQNDFIINTNPKKPKHRELLNPKVREAFAHAVDRKKMVDVVLLGYGAPASTIIAPVIRAGGVEWHNPNLKPETFDLALANKLLDSLGYKKGSDGIRVADGVKMSYSVITPSDMQSADRTFQIMQPDFRKIGVELKQRALDSSAAFNEISSPNSKYLNFDLAIWDWVAVADPDFMLSVVTCAQYGGWSDSGYCNKAYDALYSKQQLTPDKNARKAIVWQMQKLLYAARPYIWLYQLDQVDAASPKWTGLVDSFMGPFNQFNRLSMTEVHQAG
ncbi:MAG: ABC transporter substrate-binding protein [Gaiellaceae bacterium]